VKIDRRHAPTTSREFKRYDKTDMSDMEIPALKLLQGMSPEVLSQTSKLRAGHVVPLDP
jgi:hypothetical protein